MLIVTCKLLPPLPKKIRSKTQARTSSSTDTSTIPEELNGLLKVYQNQTVERKLRYTQELFQRRDTGIDKLQNKFKHLNLKFEAERQKINRLINKIQMQNQIL